MMISTGGEWGKQSLGDFFKEVHILAVVIPIAPRFMMTVVFYLYDFRILSLKLDILLREYTLNTLTFPLFYCKI